jgi:cell division protein FtsB
LQPGGSLKRCFELNVHKKNFWKVLLVILCLLASVLAWLGFGEQGLIHLYRTEMEREAHIDRIRQLAKDNQTLIGEINRLRKDMKYVESVIRKELNLIKDNEVIYRFNTDKARSDAIGKIAPQGEQHGDQN